MAHDEGMVSRHENEFTRIWQQVGALGNRMTAVEESNFEFQIGLARKRG